MQINDFQTQVQSPLAVAEKKMLLDNKIKNGVNWFFFIAALSLVNSVIFLMEGDLTFVIGLGLTQLVDGIGYGIALEMLEGGWIVRIIGLALNVGITTVFVLFGVFGRKHYRWPVILGMVLYAIDAFLLLVFEDYFGAIFHGLGLYGLFTGVKAITEWKTLEESYGSVGFAQIPSSAMVMPGQEGMPLRKKNGKVFSWVFLGILVVVMVVLKLTGG